jgi:hypothetical protein
MIALLLMRKLPIFHGRTFSGVLHPGKRGRVRDREVDAEPITHEIARIRAYPCARPDAHVGLLVPCRRLIS